MTTDKDLPLPSSIYYGAEASNFYDAETKKGCGEPFFRKWFNRRYEFPTSADEALGRVAADPKELQNDNDPIKDAALPPIAVLAPLRPVSADEDLKLAGQGLTRRLMRELAEYVGEIEIDSAKCNDPQCVAEMRHVLDRIERAQAIGWPPRKPLVVDKAAL